MTKAVTIYGKESRGKEDEQKKVVAKCDNPDEVVENCDQLTAYPE